MTFDGAWIADDTDALDATCTVALPSDPITPSSADEYGVGAAFANPPSTVDLSCMCIPARQMIDRRTGFVVSLPQQLLIADPSQQVQEASRITYLATSYYLEHLQRDGDLVLVSLKQ